MSATKDSRGVSPPATDNLEDARESLPPKGRVPGYLWAFLALLCGLLLTLAVYHGQRRRQLDEQRADMRMLADKSYVALQGSLQSSQLLLRAMQSLFLASDDVSPDEFGHGYENLHLREQLPSLIAFSYARAEAQPGGTHYVIRMIEPHDGSASLIGLDIGTRPASLQALLASRDSDQVALSAPFQLVRRDQANRVINGIVMRLPVYRPGAPPRTLAERRARMQGSISASFRIGQLIQSGLPGEALDMLHVVVHDITDARAVLLFDSDRTLPAVSMPPADRFERDLAYGGRVWSVAMTAKHPQLPPLSWRESVLPAGLLISLLLMFLVWSVAGTQRRALALGWRMSQRYRESEKRFRALNELLPALVLLADVEDGRITYSNQAARDRLGGAVGTLALPMLFEDADLRLYLQQPDTPGWGNADAVLQNGLGERFWASVSIARVQLDDREQLVMVATDITRQRELTELLSYQASHDALTELYNRREFERRLERALLAVAAGAPACALLYLDLDQFKLINDTSGHLAGDQLLAQLALVMREHLNPGDVLARLGGDEFGVLALGVHDRAAAEQMAERLRLRIDGYLFLWERRSYTISVSIGGVMIDHPQITLKDLLAQADTACYMAKELGRNRVHFYSEQDDETARRRSEMEWANRLRWAAEERRLLLTYQEVWPLSATPGEGARIELLLRFRDEAGQLVVPGAFIPAAERYGLMPVIDRWVIETTLSNFDRLHPSGTALQLAAINLSGASIEDDSLVELIIDLLKRYRVEPSRVCFEITETVAVRHLARVASFMGRLRALGCKVALDDFGVGMSSFGYLKNLPVDIIKIDGSFIRDMLTDPVSHAMVRAVTDIGHRLGLQVVAEWVTGQEIVDALVELGMDLAQGFTLHEPELVLFHRA